MENWEKKIDQHDRQLGVEGGGGDEIDSLEVNGKEQEYSKVEEELGKERDRLLLWGKEQDKQL